MSSHLCCSLSLDPFPQDPSFFWTFAIGWLLNFTKDTAQPHPPIPYGPPRLLSLHHPCHHLPWCPLICFVFAFFHLNISFSGTMAVSFIFCSIAKAWIRPPVGVNTYLLERKGVLRLCGWV